MECWRKERENEIAVSNRRRLGIGLSHRLRADDVVVVDMVKEANYE